MPPLASDLRSKLESVCIQARDRAEEAARSALQKWAVDAAEPHAHFKGKEKEMRKRLRARGRQLGDVRDEKKKTQSIDLLQQELAYEYWHRMLFARFLAENDLLMHPDGVAVSLEDCDELAKNEGAPNGFVLAARYASTMLPRIFRQDDVLLQVEFAPEHRLALEKLLASVPRETFLADDSLGWVYQFWQSKRKKEVNESGDKIDGRTLPAVTQLFTEDYMVQFLLQNTIGVWWCAKEEIEGPPGGAGVPASQCPVEMPYLRWRNDGTPAAGKFEGWPKSLAEFTMLDPCCGSGHFLVAAFQLLVPLRMQDEGLDAREACDAVLRDNIFGLELDPRCTQIAAFALALAAWKYPDESGAPLGHRELPKLNIACTGIGPQASEDEWLDLALKSGLPLNALSREPVLNGLRNVHELFSDAPTLGSLIDPNRLRSDMFIADFETLEPYLDAALKAEKADEDAHERAVAAAGIVEAAKLLAQEYALVATNVPYLGHDKKCPVLKEYCAKFHTAAKADLATCFIERSLSFLPSAGTSAFVAPQSWLYQDSFKQMRPQLLREFQFNILARLGPRAFEGISGEAVNVCLVLISSTACEPEHLLYGLDVSELKSPKEKRGGLISQALGMTHQAELLNNPQSKISLTSIGEQQLLSAHASSHLGICTGDYPRFGCLFWEVCKFGADWVPHHSSVEQSSFYGGMSNVLHWENGDGQFVRFLKDRLGEDGIYQWLRGEDAWGMRGVAITATGALSASLYLGTHFDNNITVIRPNDPENLAAIWTFCESPEFPKAVRRLNQALKITDQSMVEVPFDIEYWRLIAADKYPTGLPEPHSDNPTQWLFKGDVASSTEPLLVAAARLLDYRWPQQSAAKNAIEKLCDEDGIVCIPSVRGEHTAAERLRDILVAAYGKQWSDALLQELLTAGGAKPGVSLDDWLRNAYFEKHCKTFHHRPFTWHIWDGRKDGFSCLVNYHKLNHKALENLTYSYLGDWINAQTGAAKSGKTGADLRLVAAQELQAKLKLILAGEPPYDIFVRWKPLHEQAIGWHPDLNDGVRMNIRPFMEAGILRKNPNIKWTKDRGKEPERDKADYPWFYSGKTFTGERVNDVHLTIAEKQAARKAKGL